MAEVDSEKLQQTEKDVREFVAEETGDLLRKYFEESLENMKWGLAEARREYESALAGYGYACKVLRDEAKRRGVDLREPTLPATARARKAAKTETGPKAAPQVKRSTCSPAK
jgi:hypothetical protein